MLSTFTWAVAADTFTFSGTVMNTTNPDRPIAAQMQLTLGEGGLCAIAISLPLVGSGQCTLVQYSEKSGHFEMTSSGAGGISWRGTIDSAAASGSYRLKDGQVGYFYLPIAKASSPVSMPGQQPGNVVVPRTSAACAPAVESTISGEFHGWDGETIFKLDNGQIWEQAEYDYMYSYAYRPEVTIYESSAGCRMKVEDEEETVLVRRLK